MSEVSPFAHLYQEEIYQLPSRTIIVIDRDWAEATDEERILLAKILGSVKLTLAQVHILYLKGFSLDELAPFGPERIISFGAKVQEAAGQTYQCLAPGGVPLICADSLNALDDTRKKNLWTALRQMFKI